MEPAKRGPRWRLPAILAGHGWHLPVLLLASVAFESLFYRHGMNRLDEGWPLAAARTLAAGGTLYEDAFFVFPPGHLLAAWLGVSLDPPGLLFARALYLAFDVAAVLVLYLLGRRVMPANYAFFGALLLAIGAPASHLKQLLFGYRYLALPMLGLLAFSRRLAGAPPAWSVWAGVAVGVGLVFRLTPALATGGAIALGFAAADPRPRVWLAEWARFAGGVAAVAAPVTAVLLWQVGAETLVREVLVRPVVMVDLQSLPLPSLALPEEWTRRTLRNWVVAVEFRAFALLYCAYLGVALHGLWRSRHAADRSRAVLLFTLVVWGAVYYTRSLGRSDEPHLDSALPPVCLLLGHAASQLRRLSWPAGERARGALRAAIAAAAFATIAFLWGSDYIAHPEQRGRTPFRSTGGRVLSTHPFVAGAVDWCVSNIRRWSRPGDVILDLSASPLLVVLADREAPGGNDLIMPGTFLDAVEERAFVARLARRPPALVIWPTLPFDHRIARSVEKSAPLVTAWVRERYEERGRQGRYALWAPKGVGALPAVPGVPQLR